MDDKKNTATPAAGAIDSGDRDSAATTAATANPQEPSPEEPADKITDPEELKDRWRRDGLRLSFPDLEKLKQMKSLTHKQAATELRCSELSIRRLVGDLRLTGSEKGRIIVDEKFVEEYQGRHGPTPEEREKEEYAALMLNAASFINPRVLAWIFGPERKPAPPMSRPPLDPHVYEQIEQKMQQIEEQWRLWVLTMRIDKDMSQSVNLWWHASELFAAEVDEYQQQFRNHLWLSQLSDRVMERVMNAVDKIEHASSVLFLAMLRHHGMTKLQIEKEVRRTLEGLVNKYTGKDSDPQGPTLGSAPPRTIAEQKPEGLGMPPAQNGGQTDSIIKQSSNAGEAETPKVAPLLSQQFTHSADYRSLNYQGNEYTLTSNQAAVIQNLDEARQNGTPELGKKALGIPESSRVRDTFKHSELWRKLIVPGNKRGTYRLNLPTNQPS